MIPLNYHKWHAGIAYCWHLMEITIDSQCVIKRNIMPINGNRHFCDMLRAIVWILIFYTFAFAHFISYLSQDKCMAYMNLWAAANLSS